MCAIAYWVLQNTIIAAKNDKSQLKAAIGGDKKGKISQLLYLLAIGISFLSEWIAMEIYILVALLWLVPNKRIEKHLNQE